jgi:integrase
MRTCGLTNTDEILGTHTVAGVNRAQIHTLLAGCDRSRPTGLRNFAILTLLARLGLRSVDVAGLQHDDVDWRAGEIVIRGSKGRRDDRLPLRWDSWWPTRTRSCAGRSRPVRRQHAAQPTL